MRFTRGLFGVTILLMCLRLAGQFLPRDGETELHSRTISSLRPMSEVAERFQRVSGKVVTYEDPILAWADDFAPPGHPAYLKGIPKNPKERSFWLSTATVAEPELDIALARAVESYNRESDGPRFRVLTSKLGRHLIPAEVRNAAGEWTKAQNPLDQRIEIPTQPRFIGEHLAAITEAVGRISQIKYTFVTLWAGVGTLEVLYGKGKFPWGTEGPVVARDAVIELLDQSATTFSWNVRCSHVYGKGALGCRIVVTDLVLPTRQPNGKVEYRELQFDRSPDNRNLR